MTEQQIIDAKVAAERTISAANSNQNHDPSMVRLLEDASRAARAFLECVLHETCTRQGEAMAKLERDRGSKS